MEGQFGQASTQSAAAYVPHIGHSVQQNVQRYGDDPRNHRERAFTTGANPWDQKERVVTGKLSNPNMQHLYQGQNGASNIPNVPSIPSQFLNNSQGQGPRMGVSQSSGNAANQQSRSLQGSNQSPPNDGFLTSPIDVPTLIATKGYNPVDFDTRPFFVSLITGVVWIPFLTDHLPIVRFRPNTSLSSHILRMTCINL